VSGYTQQPSKEKHLGIAHLFLKPLICLRTYSVDSAPFPILSLLKASWVKAQSAEATLASFHPNAKGAACGVGVCSPCFRLFLVVRKRRNTVVPTLVLLQRNPCAVEEGATNESVLLLKCYHLMCRSALNSRLFE